MPPPAAPAPLWRQKLIDAIYGHPHVTGFLSAAGVVALVPLAAIAALLGLLRRSDPAAPAAKVEGLLGPVSDWPLVRHAGWFGALVTPVVCLTAIFLYVVLIRREWMVRTFYRRMYGSYYHEP